ncbi:MAG: SDR family NAD(P)-dependent oxidoreductase [Candidatus Poribacteria bacterium]|nr:SDR family NAD(P)-dependent oxidoreductase [Candidatus Poribacteria bacterium]MDP6745483.1 SDR family NAD(P)-dependent oxidoreductase [Candidatus Poribacteria bacterium]MDP6995612.1 SDR family NAD(P)-dependent oxidoreductase [Candidatus Poribacteria bacterium]
MNQPQIFYSFLAPIPYASVYASSKAYVLTFSEAIRYEYQDKGIKVMALLPGGTESEFAKVATEKSEKPTQRYKELEPGKGSGLLMPTSHEVAMKCLSAFEKKQFIISEVETDYFLQRLNFCLEKVL